MNWVGTLIAFFSIGICAVAIDGLLLWWIYEQKRAVAAVQLWPSVSGTVVKSVVETHASYKNTTYTPVVKYSYEVAGKAFTSNHVAPGGVVGGSLAESLVARFPLGAQVEVFYNPQNPKDAVLEKKSESQTILWVALIVTTITLCCGTPLYLWYLAR